MYLFTSRDFIFFSNKNNCTSNTNRWSTVVKDKNYLENYENISEEIKHITNSIVRLKILAALYECPRNMKELNVDTGLSYSSISGNMHRLELKGYVYRECNKYYLSNSMRLQIENLMELERIIEIINQFFNILDKHLVEVIPNESVAELYLIGKANLIESGDLDAYRTSNYIENALIEADYVKCVLPFYSESFNEKLNDLVSRGKSVEAIVSEEIHHIFEEKSRIENLSFFRKNNNFLLIATDKVMMLGLFKDDGVFDQNRLLISKNDDSIRWADNLFKNFKNEINEL